MLGWSSWATVSASRSNRPTKPGSAHSFGPQQFQRVESRQPRMVGQVDRAHTAGAQLPLDRVAGEDLTRPKGHARDCASTAAPTGRGAHRAPRQRLAGERQHRGQPVDQGTGVAGLRPHPAGTLDVHHEALAGLAGLDPALGDLADTDLHAVVVGDQVAGVDGEARAGRQFDQVERAERPDDHLALPGAVHDEPALAADQQRPAAPLGVQVDARLAGQPGPLGQHQTPLGSAFDDGGVTGQPGRDVHPGRRLRHAR